MKYYGLKFKYDLYNYDLPGEYIRKVGYSDVGGYNNEDGPVRYITTSETPEGAHRWNKHDIVEVWGAVTCECYMDTVTINIAIGDKVYPARIVELDAPKGELE